MRRSRAAAASSAVYSGLFAELTVEGIEVREADSMAQVACCRRIFGAVGYGYTSVPTYPSGDDENIVIIIFLPFGLF